MYSAEEQPLLAPEYEEDGMFPPPCGGLSSRKNLSSSSSSMGFADCIVAIFLPWFIFTLVLTAFIYFYYASRWLVWSLVAACLLLGALMVAMGAGRSRSIHLAVGLLSIAAACVGTSVGVYFYDTYASTYWQLQDGAEYKGLSPSSKASDHADATILSFTPDTFVDTMRTLGYMEAGVVYCVAPVASPKFSNAPQYWAAGKDCCDQRANFRCGAVSNIDNVQGKTGVLIKDESDREKYKTAIRMAEAVFNLSPTETGRFALAWTGTSDTNFKDDLWSRCHNLFFISSGMYLAFSVAAVFLLRTSVVKAF